MVNQPQLACTISQGREIIGYVVIDSMIRNRALGGLRMSLDVDEAEIRKLARTMTLKAGFLGLPHGGAKAGVIGDPEAPPAERRQRLASFGRAISPLLLSRVYSPYTDMGTNTEDIRHMLISVGIPLKRRELRGTQSEYYTAISVFAGAKQAVRHLGLDLARCAVAIEGLGKVGGALSALLATAGARVTGISTSRGAIYNSRGLDVKRLSQLTAEAGSRVVDLYTDAERIDRAALLELPVDLLCPCARHDSINAGNAHRVAARIVCSGANNPVTIEGERILFERGVLCLPDFSTNCGGMLGGDMEFASIGRERIVSFIDRQIGARISWLLKEADRQHATTREIAVPFTLDRFSHMCRNAAYTAPIDRLIKLGLSFYKRGWIPRSLSATLSPLYFEKMLCSSVSRR
jgi:glutamate dehydrogenase/leucine dehydrogenase